MRPEEDIRKTIRRWNNKTSERMDERVLGDALHAMDESQGQEPYGPPFPRRSIMKNPITKLAVAAAVIAAVVLGLFEFVSTDAGAGVVWAEVAQKVEASHGVSFRLRETGGQKAHKNWPRSYSVVRRSPTLSRTDWYIADRLSRTVFIDWPTRSVIWLSHNQKIYSKKTLTDEDVQNREDAWTDPQGLISLGLNRELHELGQKTIDGILCEGVGTNDLRDGDFTFPVKSFSARMWVSVETGYPILVEVEATGGDDGSIRRTSTLDKFQWNLDIEESAIKPEIPSDYECID